MTKEKDIPYQAETKTVQALGWVDDSTRAVVPPVHSSTIYLRDHDNQYRSGYSYGRDTNPTYDLPQQLLAELEHGKEALLFSSGMSAATAVFQALPAGSHVLAPKIIYWGLRQWLLDIAEPNGLDVEFFDNHDSDSLARAVQRNRTRLIWLETPANPTWVVSDIAQAAEIAHAVGARLCVDNTVPTPVLSQPLQLGADLVMHSATKYLNGHSDVLAGALVTAQDDEFWQRIGKLRQLGGAIPGSFESWLLLRGMRTLYLRVQRACQSALRIASHFQQHAGIETVLYPGLPEHPGHNLAARQMQGGFGGMLSLQIRGGEAAAIAVATNTGLWKRTTSLGGVESLLEHRASVEGSNSPVPVNLLRLSVGIEDCTDLIADLEQALAASQ